MSGYALQMSHCDVWEPGRAKEVRRVLYGPRLGALLEMHEQSPDPVVSDQVRQFRRILKELEVKEAAA